MKTKKGVLIHLFIYIIVFLTFGFWANTSIALTSGANDPASSTPIISSAYVVSISSTRAVLNGSVNPNGANTDAWFRIGTPISPQQGQQNIGSGTSSVSLNSYVLIGLTPGTSYSFRLEASNQNGNSYGNWISFTTLTSSSGNTNNNWNSNTWNSTYYNNSNNNWGNVWNGSQNTNGAISVTTSNADTITETSARLHGFIKPNNYSATGWFEYGTFQSMEKYENTNQIPINSSTSAMPIYANIKDLSANTIYYFRAVGKNYVGTITKGSILSFTTKKAVETATIKATPAPSENIVPPAKSDITNTFINKDQLKEGFSNTIKKEKTGISYSLWGWILAVFGVFVLAFVFAKVRGKNKHRPGLKSK